MKLPRMTASLSSNLLTTARFEADHQFDEKDGIEPAAVAGGPAVPYSCGVFDWDPGIGNFMLNWIPGAMNQAACCGRRNAFMWIDGAATLAPCPGFVMPRPPAGNLIQL